MVKNEEDFLEDALASAQGWCDEMVVVDTGSTDRSVEIAQDMGAKVSFFEWCNDFSAARNETLRRSSGQWLVILDADERFRSPDPTQLRKHLAPSAHWPYQALMLNVVNTRLDGSPISSFFSVRVFPNDPRLGYFGRVHNRFGPLVADAPLIDTHRYLGTEIIHLGYDPEIYARRQKAARSLPLIEATVREEPENHQHRYYLGREYLLLGRVDEACEQLGRAFEGILERGQGPVIETATHYMQALARQNGPVNEVLAVGTRALKLAPTHPDLWFEVGRNLVRIERLEEAARALETALENLDKVVFDGQVHLLHRRWQAHEILGHIYWALQQSPQSYAHYLQTLSQKPADEDGWPKLLNSLCALAIELNDDERRLPLLERLLAHPKAPLGMFFFEVERRAKSEGRTAAALFLAEMSGRFTRVIDNPEYQALRNALEEP